MFPSAQLSIFCFVLVQMTCHAFWCVHENPPRALQPREEPVLLDCSQFIPLVSLWSWSKVDGRVQCCSLKRSAMTFVLIWHILKVFLRLKIRAWILEKWTLVYVLTLTLCPFSSSVK